MLEVYSSSSVNIKTDNRSLNDLSHYVKHVWVMDENKNLILDSIAKKRGSPLIIQLVVSCNCPPA